MSWNLLERIELIFYLFHTTESEGATKYCELVTLNQWWSDEVWIQVEPRILLRFNQKGVGDMEGNRNALHGRVSLLLALLMCSGFVIDLSWFRTASAIELGPGWWSSDYVSWNGNSRG